MNLVVDVLEVKGGGSTFRVHPIVVDGVSFVFINWKISIMSFPIYEFSVAVCGDTCSKKKEALALSIAKDLYGPLSKYFKFKII